MSTEKIEIPIPRLAPFGLALYSPETVQEVWDTFVKPDQDAGILQSVEMRALMAILRAVHKGLVDANLDPRRLRGHEPVKPQWQVKMTLPEKDQPYTQHDMDIVIGHPIELTMNVVAGNSSRPLPMRGTITAAEIQPDGSAVVTMDVSS